MHGEVGPFDETKIRPTVQELEPKPYGVRKIFKQISAVKSGKIAIFHKTIDFQNFLLCYSNGFDLFRNVMPWGFWGSP